MITELTIVAIVFIIIMAVILLGPKKIELPTFAGMDAQRLIYEAEEQSKASRMIVISSQNWPQMGNGDFRDKVIELADKSSHIESSYFEKFLGEWVFIAVPRRGMNE